MLYYRKIIMVAEKLTLRKKYVIRLRQELLQCREEQRRLQRRIVEIKEDLKKDFKENMTAKQKEAAKVLAEYARTHKNTN